MNINSMNIRMNLIDAYLALRPIIRNTKDIGDDELAILIKSSDAIIEEMTEEESEYLSVKLKAQDTAGPALTEWLVQNGYY